MSDDNYISNSPANSGLPERLAGLEWDVEPDRDLWPDISSRIRFAENRRKKKAVWAPLAVAASLVVAVGSLMFSWMSFQMASDNRQRQAMMVTYQQAQLQLIEQQHKMVRVQFVQLLRDKRELLNPDFITEAELLMANIDQASTEIKKAMTVQPNDPDYASMLVSTYQQEINLLNKIKPRPAVSNKGISI